MAIGFEWDFNAIHLRLPRKNPGVFSRRFPGTRAAGRRASSVPSRRRMKRPTLARKCAAEHRMTVGRFFACYFVPQHAPMFGKLAAFDPQEVRRDQRTDA
ncbi:hypothetical protein [Burkholderia pyrrocinia]|uniref:hypothetical protein n=1 Tax=Burkholderia pyrrocinia TaxID=60550 RepID=UPI001588A26F|nr:hypothetical protein [Burkholderia pyrrocinia]